MKKLIALILSLCMLLGMLPAMAETAAEAPAELEKINMNRLINNILNDILNAVIRVDAADAEAQSAAPEEIKANVFTILKSVLKNMAEAKARDGKTDEDLDQLITILDDPETLKNMDEKEFEVLASLTLVAIIAETETWDEAARANEIPIASKLLKTVYDACKENETLAAAVKAADSGLFEMLEVNNSFIQEYVEKTGSLDVVDIEVDETSYAEFEAEIKKVEDYLNGLEGPKQDALDMLALLHAIMDDIHEAIDGHVHDDYKEVDHYQLVAEMLDDLGEAISKIDLDEIRERGGENFNTAGSVYAVFEKIVNNILADEAAENKESEETLTKILETIGNLDDQNVTEEEAEALFALMFMGSAEEQAAAGQIDPEVDFLRSTHILRATYDTMLENDTIVAALEATGSRLPEMLVNTGEKMQAYLKEHGTLHQIKDVDEAPFIAFEAEFAKLRDYVEGLEKEKGKKALDLLDLLHEYVDDIHEAVDGHTHEHAAE